MAEAPVDTSIQVLAIIEIDGNDGQRQPRMLGWRPLAQRPAMPLPEPATLATSQIEGRAGANAGSDRAASLAVPERPALRRAS
jgi:hypothetical protein